MADDTRKKVLLTGAGRGIGAAIARQLGANSFEVALTARSQDQLEAVRDDVEKNGGIAHVFPADLGDLAQLPGLVHEATEKMGGLDVLINNAGMFTERSLQDMELEEWDRILRVNATAPYILCREALSWLEKSVAGKIIMISSTSGTKGYLDQSAYCASKHAMLGLARALEIELKPKGIKLHTLCPGGVETDLIVDTYLSERMKGELQLKPEDIADAVYFLLNQPDRVSLSEMTIRRHV